MASCLARKFFSRTVSVTGGTAITYADIMRSAAAVTGSPAWGTNADGSISMDSFVGGSCVLIPVTSTAYVGHDAAVAATNTASTYVGAPAVAGDPFSVPDFIRGPVDTNAVWIFTASSQDFIIVFQGD
jgi:hypothetical protein